MDGDGFPVERRIRAAMTLAAIDFGELARRIDRPGMKERTLRGMATAGDRQTAQPHHLRYIAEACGMSPSFFTVDFSADLATDAELRTRLQNAETQLASLVGLADRFNGLEQELREVRDQTEQLTQESLERRQREAGERESARRATRPGTPGARDDRRR
jgi:hypothetical protein